MTKRSNRTRGNRKLNMGASLRARQMTSPRHTGRGGSQHDVLLPPDLLPDDMLLVAENLDLLITEDEFMMVAEA
jgi:hypothetical protein